MSVNRPRSLVIVLGLALLNGVGGCQSTFQLDLEPKPFEGAVATVDPRATQAGLDALAEGGNAVDAAVAAALTLGVVDMNNSGIGGGCFLLLRRPNGEVLALDGREMAPAAAHRDMYLRDGKADPELSRTGALAIGVPGSLAAMDRMLAEAGRFPLSYHLLRAADLAERGFRIGPALAKKLKKNAKHLRRFPATRALLLDRCCRPWPESHVLRQPDLACMYRNIARCGIGYFYGGPFARQLECWMRCNGGVVTAKDFADYEVKERVPVRSTYHGHEIVGFPPPSSGGLHVAQILTMLERFDLVAMDVDRPVTRRHVMTEAMKRAFADRAHWLGDPDFADVPRGLLDADYLRGLAEGIDPAKSTEVPAHGTPPNVQDDLFERHTTHLVAADADGTWVSMTTTLNAAFGSEVLLPGTGVLLNNQMDDFAAQPGVPNLYGLVGAEANAVEPGKRPLSSMSPTLVLKDGEPVLALGAAGGPTIISQVVQVLVSWIDLGATIEEAVAGPRIHHQWKPDRIAVEEQLSEEVVRALEALGHGVKVVESMGVTQAVLRRPDGSFTTVRDPRVPVRRP